MCVYNIHGLYIRYWYNGVYVLYMYVCIIYMEYVWGGLWGCVHTHIYILSVCSSGEPRLTHGLHTDYANKYVI